MKEIRDPIYGFIEPGEDEWKILDSPLLQRLRRIRQLALAYLVYPGALHTRFDHSLGVYYLSSRMADRLLEREEKEKIPIIKMAALLHDVGHGPFSHVSESILDLYFDQHQSSESTEKIHEKITAKLIRNDKVLTEIIGRDKIDEIIGLLSGEKVDFSLMKQIVSGPIDADKQDYLLRDSYFCGVKYGVYDYNRMINTFQRYNIDGDFFIGVQKDGIHALEQFILAKYYMTWQVYRHRVRLITDEMIIRAIELGIDRDEIDELKRLYIFEDSEDYFDNYLKWWDDRLINFLVFEIERGFAHDMFVRLYYRDLLKKVFSIKIKDEKGIPGPTRTVIQKVTQKENKEKRRNLEMEIANVVGAKPEETIINSYLVKSVKEVSRDNEGEGRISILKEDGSKANFEEESTVFESIDGSLKEVWVEVYAPVNFKDRRDREKKLKEWKKEIIDIITDLS
jgi:HD superfamily phosphohydrolase